MNDAWRSIRLTEFEHVVTGPSQSLLRVGGRAPDDRAAGARPVLVMQTPSGEARFHPLPAPSDRPGVLRAAYAVPTSIVSERGSCWLQLADGARLELPEPESGAGRRRDGVLAQAQAPDEPMAPAPADPGLISEAADELINALAEVASLRAQLAARDRAAAPSPPTAPVDPDRVAALERELGVRTAEASGLRDDVRQLQHRQRTLERELDQARDQLRLMTFERDELERQAQAFDAVAIKARERASAAETAHAKSESTLNELQVWRAELERRLAATTTELGALRAAHDADERELVRLRTALSQYERAGAHPGPNG
ncbi:MAG TPA: hypothetical protein VFN55_08700 [Solirubrobacteraceae bacterium]|nr:hypothetical protein [Solirubrobacteraceae bacterium]